MDNENNYENQYSEKFKKIMDFIIFEEDKDWSNDKIDRTKMSHKRNLVLALTYLGILNDELISDYFKYNKKGD